MRISTVWLIADQGNIENVVSQISENVDTLSEWPHIFLDGLGQLELAQLWKIIHPGVPENHVSEELLLDRHDEGIYLTTLNRQFVHALEWVDDSKIDDVAAEWARSIQPMHSQENLELGSKLLMLVGLVKQAMTQQKVILQAIRT